jgi:hypothetical protein
MADESPERSSEIHIAFAASRYNCHQDNRRDAADNLL